MTTATLPAHRTPGLTIRPCRPADVPLVRGLSDHASATSLYHRFFVGSPRIPAGYLRSLQTVDHWNREILLAIPDSGDHTVAIAEYVRDRTDPRTAEMAMLVADAWQRHGLSRLLIDALGELAHARGITHFTAETLPDNQAAQAAILRHRPGALTTHHGDSLLFHMPVLAQTPREVPQ
ncbi:GNAT family N-acetyltransferase [Streptosporangium sp. G11]|uniref:GNAT family N-acetyltransferase n=1 Tax=Streptosporangium sp. G11 TaxID=3436926 RepID=UPI003EBD3024